MDGESFAYREAMSPKGCEHDASNKRKTSETDGTMPVVNQTFSYDFENEAMMAKFRLLRSDKPEGQVQGCTQQDRLKSWTSAGSVLNQNQYWNLSLEGAWTANTVNGITENCSFNAAYENEAMDGVSFAYRVSDEPEGGKNGCEAQTLSSDANPMSHDRKGNLTQNKDSSNYTWESKVMDDERSLALPARMASTGCAQHFDNQLSYAINSINDASAYTYDALGRRVSKDYQDKLTIFVHSGYQILSEFTSDNGQPFTEKQSHIFGAYIDDIIAIINTNGIFYAHSNRQFSVGAITNSLGQLEERYAYNAYGSPVEIFTSTNVDNPFYFTGRQLDSETGLFYFRARYYDANLGQFISRDPIGYVDGMNLYRGYFAVNNLDPSGTEEITTLDMLWTAISTGIAPPGSTEIAALANTNFWCVLAISFLRKKYFVDLDCLNIPRKDKDKRKLCCLVKEYMDNIGAACIKK